VDVLEALAEVRDVLVDERSDEVFYEAAERFLLVFHGMLEEQGLRPVPFEQWDPRPALVPFEAALLADQSLDVGLAAAAKTVHDSLDAAREQMASLN
jgi:hypothetical protein